MTDLSRQYRKKHLQNQLQIADRTKAAIARIGDKIAVLVNNPNAKFVKSFDFRNNDHLNKIITGLMTDLHGNLLDITKTAIATSWAISNEKNNAVVKEYFTGLESLKHKEATYLNTNSEALKAFLDKKVDGKTLSDRVWTTVEAARDELEVQLGFGIANGDSAAKISKRIRDYLNNPEALFRRVRDESGKLGLSENAKQFHPGQGVYRSAYKNALRVTRSETNQAYLLNDHLRWKQMDFVTGVHIELSEQHPTPDVCDAMAGDYPKGYVFTGWHSQCLCHATPIMMPKDQFKKYVNGQQVNVAYVSDVPKGYKQWIYDNKQRIEGWKSKPYFIADNYKNGNISEGLNFKTYKGKAPVKNTPEVVIDPNKFNPATTKDEAKSFVSKLFNDNLGINPKSVTFHDILSLDQINARTEQIDKLFKEYEPARVYSKNNDLLKVMCKSESFFLGRISTSNDGTILHEINFGSKNDPARVNLLPGFATKSKVDADNLEISTTTHEFAHLLTIQSHINRSYLDERLATFMPELKKIKTGYTKELNSYARAGKNDEVNNIYLGDYSSTNLNEFMAEAFTEYKLKSNPSKYAKIVGELIDKTFKRK